jgi:hypothetical protein
MKKILKPAKQGVLWLAGILLGGVGLFLLLFFQENTGVWLIVLAGIYLLGIKFSFFRKITDFLGIDNEGISGFFEMIFSLVGVFVLYALVIAAIILFMMLINFLFN